MRVADHSRRGTALALRTGGRIWAHHLRQTTTTAPGGPPDGSRAGPHPAATTTAPGLLHICPRCGGLPADDRMAGLCPGVLPRGHRPRFTALRQALGGPETRAARRTAGARARAGASVVVGSLVRYGIFVDDTGVRRVRLGRATILLAALATLYVLAVGATVLAAARLPAVVALVPGWPR